MTNITPSSTSSDRATSFTLAARLKSFRYAFSGIRLMLVSQHNAWVHVFATIAVVVASFGLGITRTDWCWVVLAIVGVWTAEALNTAFELLCDVASPGFHPMVKNAKDVAAGAVLVAAVGAGAIGILVLGPAFLTAAGAT